MTSPFDDSARLEAGAFSHVNYLEARAIMQDAQTYISHLGRVTLQGCCDHLTTAVRMLGECYDAYRKECQLNSELRRYNGILQQQIRHNVRRLQDLSAWNRTLDCTVADLTVKVSHLESRPENVHRMDKEQNAVSTLLEWQTRTDDEEGTCIECNTDNDSGEGSEFPQTR
ncbi:hypothetical protein ACJ73_03566 [Blastomyces percursus]|uniref:Uncharacterized protein n=1 Tax=Blastomyces percursus TaxID=1658174 RepID=A0A1J9QAI9_9EURO|nr:hypothetical protein ACJ73_03566 [Blastomyces percursus]